MLGFEMLGIETFFTLFFLAAALIAGVIVFSLGWLIWRTVKNVNAPKVQWVATVVAKRLQVSGGSESASTTYFITFETPAGERREFAVKGKQYGQLVEGDQGTVHTQGTWFLQLDRTR